MNIQSLWEKAYQLHEKLEDRVLKRKGFKEFEDKGKVTTYAIHTVGQGLRGSEIDSIFAALTACKKLGNCDKVEIVIYGEHSVNAEHRKYSLNWKNEYGSKIGIIEPRQLGVKDLTKIQTSLGNTPYTPNISTKKGRELINTPYNGKPLYEVTKYSIEDIVKSIDIDGSIKVEVIKSIDLLQMHKSLINDRIDELVNKYGDSIKELFLKSDGGIKSTATVLILDQGGLPFGNMHGYQVVLPLVLGKEGEIIAEIISYRGGCCQDGLPPKNASILEDIGIIDYKKYLAISKDNFAYTQMITKKELNPKSYSNFTEEKKRDLGFTALPILSNEVGETLANKGLISNSYKANNLWLMEKVYELQSKMIDNGELPRPFSVSEIRSLGDSYKKSLRDIFVRS